MVAPKPGVTLDGCKVVRVLDADTVEVEMTRTFRVRIRDCWAAETKRTNHPSEKHLGIFARGVAENEYTGEDVIVHVETDGGKIGDNITFGRVLGQVWKTNDEECWADKMIRKGHAFTTKKDLEDFLNKQDAALRGTYEK